MARIIITPTNVELLENGFKGRVAHNGTIEVFNKEGKTIEQFKKEEVIDSKFLNNIFLKEMVTFDKNIRTNNYNFLRYDFSIEEVSKMNKDAQTQLDGYSFSDVIKFNSSQVDELMKNFNMKNTRDDKNDFDGGNFSGSFDEKLLELGYVRVCVERKDLIESMVVVQKDKLDTLIQKHFSVDLLLDADKSYTSKDSESYEDFVDAYYNVTTPILKDLGFDSEHNNYSNFTSMYVDGIDYILNESEKLGYKFGAEKFASNEDSPLEKIVGQYEESLSKGTSKEQIKFGTPIDWYNSLMKLNYAIKTNKPSMSDETQIFWFEKDDKVTDCLSLKENLQSFNKSEEIPFNIQTQIGDIKITQETLKLMNENFKGELENEAVKSKRNKQK